MFIQFDNNTLLKGDAKKVFLEQIYYVNKSIIDCNITNDGIDVKFDIHAKIDENDLADKINNLSDSIIRSFDRVEAKIMFNNPGKVTNTKDPLNELLSTRQAVQTAPGVFILQGDFLDTINRLDNIFKEYALERGAIEQHYQSTVPTTSLMKNGYVSSFPQHLFFVESVHRDLDSIQLISKKAKDEPSDNLFWLDEHLDEPNQILSPTVCYHTFEGLRGQCLPASGAEFTAIASCHRYESHNVQGLSRLQTFTMREIIFFGSTDSVEKSRTEILEHCKLCLVDWDVKFRIVTASDPFFTNGSESKRIFQSVMELKYEIQVYLPHSDSWLSIASFNNHQQSLVKPYDITFQSGAPLYSGCVGYGYERLAYALYSQFGCNRSSWPKGLKEIL
ncbi:MAG: aminoacyl--tRNA ligase-related protein [bacterium]